MKILKDPFVQFLFAGALIFAAYSLSQSAERFDAERRIVIDAPTQDWIYSNFEKQFRRPPSRAEMDALIQSYIENEVKYREALTMGLDQRDSIVRRRMMQKFDFLFGNSAADVLPDDAALQSWYADHAGDFTVPMAISFRHLWFSPDSRGSAAARDAQAALAELQAGNEAAGDPFPFERTFADATPVRVQAVLGGEFAKAVFEAPIGEWSGPIASGLGQHLVYVEDKADSEIPPLDEVRELVVQRWRDDESERRLREMVAALTSGYAIALDAESLETLTYAPDGVGHAP